MVPPRLPDILPHVYHRRRPALELLVLPQNLAERARISAINLVDYQIDPLTPPPSHSYPFSMAAYQQMTAGTDPTKKEEALTVYEIETGQNSVPVL
ncbi:hypothetical protein Tco_0463362, partial [Tanacetum coccineum]